MSTRILFCPSRVPASPSRIWTTKSCVRLVLKSFPWEDKCWRMGDAVAAKMGSKEQGGRICVKESIKYICELITELGVTGLIPENLRLAKFNKLPAPGCLLRALHDLVALYIACFPVNESSGKSGASVASSSSSPHDSTPNPNPNPNPAHGPPASSPAPTRKVLGQKVIPNSVADSQHSGKKSATGSVKNFQAQKSIVTLRRVECSPKDANEQEKELDGSVAPRGTVVALERVCQGSPDADTLAFVKFYLALWGYPPHSPFFTLSADTHESRHFLLALGWLVSHCNVIERALERRLRPLRAARNLAPLPHAYPPDTCCSPEALAKAREAECAAHDYVERMIAASDNVEDETLQTEMRADQALMLYGKVRACLNGIQALQVSKVKKMHELQVAQLAAGLKKPYTQYELHLLQHREKLDLHCNAMAAAKAIDDEREACEKHEDLFWQWMESVAHEALMEQAPTNAAATFRSPSIDLAGVSEPELRPVIEYLKQELAACGHGSENESSALCAGDDARRDPRSCVPLQPELSMEMLTALSESLDRVESFSGVEESLPRHAEDVAHGLLKEPVYVYRPEKKKLDGGTSKPGVVNEEEFDPQSALVKIKRLAEVDEMVKRVLAKTRAENRTVILEILKPLLEDDSYVFVGL